MEEKSPGTDVQLWCEEYVKNQTMNMTVNGTLGTYSDPRIFGDIDYVTGLKLFAYVIIFTGGLLGNVSVMLTVLLNRSMRSTTNVYVANLALSDALICIFCMVPEALETVTQDRIFILGKFMCSFNPFTSVMCLTCSSLTLTAISCDRSVAILYPFRSRVTKQRPSLVITFIWVISVAIAVPNYITKKYVVHKFENFEMPKCQGYWTETYQYYEWSEEKCHSYHPLFGVYIAVVSVVLFFLPMLIMSVAYSLILWRLWKTELPGEKLAANVDAHKKAKKKVNKMVFVVLVVFIICWTPEEIVMFKFVSLDSTIDAEYPDWLYELYWYSGFLAYFNSFLNPFIYGGFDKHFLKGFSTIVPCGLKRNSREGSAQPRITLTSCVPTKNTSETWYQQSTKSVEMKLLEESNGNVSAKAMDS